MTESDVRTVENAVLASARVGAEGPKEECGVFGVWAPGEDVARLIYFALFAQRF